MRAGGEGEVPGAHGAGVGGDDGEQEAELLPGLQQVAARHREHRAGGGRHDHGGGRVQLGRRGRQGGEVQRLVPHQEGAGGDPGGQDGGGQVGGDTGELLLL